MKFQHYTAKPLIFDPTIQYELGEEKYFKPAGFWVSVEGEDDWKDWCTREEFRIDTLTHCTEFEIDLSNVLVLTTTDEILQFGKSYDNCIVKNSHWIHWDAVAKDYSGIIIPIYNWHLRLHPDTPWYYAWDCASGCIWDLSTTKEKK